jgi:hypothetical protein
VAAAQAALGSHQPLRDLRRRIALARAAAPEPPPPPRGGRSVPSVDASTVGVHGDSVAAARRLVESGGGRGGGGAPPMPPPAGGAPAAGRSWLRPPLRGPLAAGATATAVAGPTPPTFGVPEATGGFASPRLRWVLLGVGALVLLLVLALLVRWLVTRPAGEDAATPTPTPAVAASVAGTSFGVGVQPSPATTAAAPRPADREATIVQQAPAAWPAGVPRRPTVVEIDVLVGPDGRAIETRLRPGATPHPRLVAEARRVAERSRYLPALRGGVPAESWMPLRVDFQAPR